MHFPNPEMTEICLAEKAKNREERIGMSFSVMDACLAKKGMNVAFKRPLVSLKTLYSDFVVRELSPVYRNGEPLVLEPLPVAERSSSATTKLTAAKRPRDKAEQNGEERKDPETTTTTVTTTNMLEAEQNAVRARVQEKFASLLAPEDLSSLVDSLFTDVNRVEIRGSLTKAQRTQVHEAVKETLAASHISRTLDGILVIEKSTSATRRESMRRSNPVRLRKFLHFTLYKENIDSNRALRSIATFLGLPLRQIVFSGTKDKRAVTLQRAAVRGLSCEKLAEINDRSFGPQSKVKVCGFQEEDFGLRLGDTLGNHFHIVLRLLPDSPEPSHEMVEIVQEILSSVGVVNYYGPQRFGTTEVLTSDVGLKLLSGEFEGALRMMFHSKAIVESNLVPVAEAVDRRAFDEALKLLPRYCFQERDILKHLVKFPNDILGAFHMIPRTLGMLYCHAVQSLIWNNMASKRMVFGLEPLPGDLVLKSLHAYIQEKNSRPICDNKGCNDAMFSLKEDGLVEVVRLTAEDVATGLFHLEDVLLTVPGPDEELLFPDVHGCTREDYIATMTLCGAEGLMNTKNPLVKVYHYHGTYRPLVVRPKRLQMRLVDTKGPREVVIPTDLERLMESTTIDNNENKNGEMNHDSVQDSSSMNTVNKAIVAEFTLPPGSYATCVLREFSSCCSEGYHVATTTDVNSNDSLNAEAGEDAAA